MALQQSEPPVAEYGAVPIIRRTGPTGSPPLVSRAAVPPLATMAKSLARRAMATRLRAPVVQSSVLLCAPWESGRLFRRAGTDEEQVCRGNWRPREESNRKSGRPNQGIDLQGILSPYKITLGKPSGDYGPPETRFRTSRPSASQATSRQTLVKSRIFLVPTRPERPYRHRVLAGVREPRRNSLRIS